MYAQELWWYLYENLYRYFKISGFVNASRLLKNDKKLEPIHQKTHQPNPIIPHNEGFRPFEEG